MDYAALLVDVVPECRGVPEPLAIGAVSQAVRKFCKDSSAYRKTLISSELSYANGIYTITKPAGVIIESVVSPVVAHGYYVVYEFSDGSESTSPTPPPGETLTGSHQAGFTGYRIQGASPEWLDVHKPDWRLEQSEADIQYFVRTGENTFILTPDNGLNRKENLVVTLSLSPERATTTIPDDFGNRWFDVLAAGAKHFLMVMPGTEWSSPELALFYREKFDTGIQEAISYTRTGQRRTVGDGVPRTKSYYK